MRSAYYSFMSGFSDWQEQEALRKAKGDQRDYAERLPEIVEARQKRMTDFAKAMYKAGVELPRSFYWNTVW